eukprot:CAMPEP_0182447128 /NCGR_PEP_ID=MMETSP1172-20130603/11752_1 /TAXON_ID=708627 /ORGANISM="Timspurckia oligopyrenoides, Strain CCMP3278" /LENGTH=382 /DNA_ID=CAMNT_0024643441 /DNA_START=72 /DNA_END=1217 /DNA_ORIENTATION=+
MNTGVYTKGAPRAAEVEELPPLLHDLFVVYDAVYFETRLQNAGVCIRWSNKSMVRCAGYCKKTSNGAVEIVISEPLHKFRSNTELKETVLHEMIHALDFISPGSRFDHDGHGEFFQRNMARINTATSPDPYRPASGYHITIFHNFVDEVRFHQQHHWRCNVCGNIIRRSMNREPSEKDCRSYRKDGSKWIHNGSSSHKTNRCGDNRCFTHNHMRTCKGSYIKIAAPEVTQQARKIKSSSTQSKTKLKQPTQLTLPVGKKGKVDKDSERKPEKADAGQISNAVNSSDVAREIWQNSSMLREIHQEREHQTRSDHNDLITAKNAEVQAANESEIDNINNDIQTVSDDDEIIITSVRMTEKLNASDRNAINQFVQMGFSEIRSKE